MNILFVQTGGTIDKAYPKSNKGYAFEIHDAAFNRILSRGQVDFEYESLCLFRKDSTELTAEDRIQLKKKIEESSFNRIVITHGSDTMIETAQFVAERCQKTIVFTAAFLPEAFRDSDADFNLGMAVAVVQVNEPGVYIVMNGQVFVPSNCKKNEENGKFEKIYE